MKPTRSTTPRHPPGMRPAPVAHLAVVDEASGASGSPTPSEREAVYLATLRQGEPRRGWLDRLARQWGLAPQVVSREVEEARQLLQASRTPDAAQVLAHELTLQAIELGDDAQQLASAPLARQPGDTGEVIEALAKARESQVKALASVAGLKLKCASSLLAIWRPKGPSVVVQGAPAPLTAAAVRGGG